MTKIVDIIQSLEALAPPAFQESYDNSGLLTGDPSHEVTGVLVSLDCTEPIVEEAIENKCNLIVAHHPILFRGIKQLTGKTYVERTLIRAIKNDIAIYAIHTNLDHVLHGVNHHLLKKLGLQPHGILSPKPDTLSKLITFVPLDHTEAVLKALGEAGAGQIGNYQNCSFRTQGTGTFQPNDQAQPFIGESGKLEEVNENRLEVLYPTHLEGRILDALYKSHPYEEVAYYLHRVANQNQEAGAGMIGSWEAPLPEEDFLATVKEKLHLEVIKHSPRLGRKIKTVAVCGGSGSFLIPIAKKKGVQAFITSDIKYHEYFDAEDQLVLLDVGHYESEVHIKEVLHQHLRKKFTNIAVNLSAVNTNPVSSYK